jgi:hypothetical protein
MKIDTAKSFIFATLIYCSAVMAGEIRLSFLDDNQTLTDTCGLLRTHGVSEKAVMEFRHLVENHNEGGNGVVTNRFPAKNTGWYKFHTLSELTNRQSCEFARTPGKTTLVCYDVVGLLLYGGGSTADKLYVKFDSKEILQVSFDRKKIENADIETFRTGIGLLFPANGYEYLVGRPRSESETKLGLSLRAPRKIRPGETETDATLQARFIKHIKALGQDGFQFSTNTQLGMVFYVDAKRGFIKAEHGFICLRSGNKLTTLEKTSPTGPYVRGEFESEEDLAAYASMAERADTNNPQDCDYGETVIVSLNDRLIGIFRPRNAAGTK